MSASRESDGPAAPPAVSEKAVRRYLERNPEFFARHTDLLAELCVPHPSGAAQSLIERQVSVLRTRNAYLDRRLRGLLDQASRNESTSERLHRLGLALLQCRGLDDVFDVLTHRLEVELGVERAELRLFVDTPGAVARAAGSRRRELVAAGPASGFSRLEADCHAALRAQCEPSCGTLPRSVSTGLFGWPSEDVGSGVILPFDVCCGNAVLVLASRDRRRFQPTMGTLFLERLAAVLGAAIDRCFPGHP